MIVLQQTLYGYVAHSHLVLPQIKRVLKMPLSESLANLKIISRRVWYKCINLHLG